MASIHVATAAGIFGFGDGSEVALPDRDVTALAGDDGGWWALSGHSLLHRTPGTEWVDVATVEGPAPTCVRPTVHGVLIGTEEAHLLRMEGNSPTPVAGFEDAPGRDEWFTPWGGPPAVRSIAASGDVVHVNVHVGGILRTKDAGEWSPTIDIRSDVHEVIARGEDVVAATALGLATSPDGGDTWDFTDEGLHASYARAVALAGDQLLMTASLGPRGGRGGIYRRAMGSAEPFVKVHAGIPEWFPDNIDSGCVSADGELVAFGTADGHAYVSEDSGTSWEELAAGLPLVQAVVVAR
jgi:hypothetical protein